MGINPEAVAWEINPQCQIKSVQVWQDIVYEEIEKLKAPEEVVKSGFALEVDGNGELFQAPLEETLAAPSLMNQAKKCECGSGKLGIPHSLWCPAI